MGITASTLITRSLIKARIFSPYETIPGDIFTRCLSELNDLLESLSIDRNVVVGDSERSFPLTSGTENYTYGSGGDFDSAQPVVIKDESFVRQGDTDYPVKIISTAEYREIKSKGSTGIPKYMAYEVGSSLTTVYLYPTPTSGLTLHMKVTEPVTSFADLTTEYTLQTGGNRMLIHNFAVELCGSFGKSVTKELASSAWESLQLIKSQNRKKHIRPLRTDHVSKMARRGVSGNITNGPFI